MSRIEAELEDKAARRLGVFAAWTPAFDDAMDDDDGACPSEASDDDIFGL